MNLGDILDNHGIPVAREGQRGGRRGWLNFECSYCGRYPYMGYNLHGHYLNCWSCGKKNLTTTLMLLLGRDRAYVNDLCRQLDRRTAWTPEARPGGVLRLPPGLGPLGPPHRRYLRDRGLSPAILPGLWGVKGIGPAGGRFAWRIFIPVERYGKTISWTTRAIGDKNVRYITANKDQEAFPAKEWLFGWDYVRHGVIVCEGPFDAMRIGPGAVATMGTHASPAQINLLANAPVRAICFDNERAALGRARTLAASLGGFPGETHVVRLDAKDPASATDEELNELRERFLV